MLPLPEWGTTRILKFWESAIYTFPALSSATPVGELSCASRALSPSPLNPGLPLPMMVKM